MPASASLTFKLFGIDVNARRTIDSVGVAAAGTAKQIETLGTKTLKMSAMAGAAGVAVNGLGVAALGAAGAISTGLVVAVGTAAIKFAAMSQQVSSTWQKLGQDMQRQTVAMSGPVQNALLGVAEYARAQFTSIKPAIAAAFNDLKPIVGQLGSGFVDAGATAIRGLDPLLRSLQPLVVQLSAHIVPVVQSLGQALNNMIGPLSRNSAAFGQFLTMVENLLPQIGALVGTLVNIGAQALPAIAPLLSTILGALGPVLNAFARLGVQIMPTLTRTLQPLLAQLGSGLGRILPLVGNAINSMLPPLGHLVSVFLQVAQQVLPTLLPILAQVVSVFAGAAAQVLPALIPPLMQIVQAFAQILPAITPLLAPIGTLLAAASNLVAPLASLAAALAAALAPALQAVGPLLVDLSSAIGGALADAIQTITPALQVIASSLGDLLVGALQVLIPLIKVLAPIFANIAGILAGSLAAVLPQLIPPLQQMFKAFGQIVAAAAPLLPVLAQVLAALVPIIVPVTKLASVLVTLLVPAFKIAVVVISYAVEGIVTVVKFMGDAILDAIIGILQAASHLPFVGGKFASAAQDVRNFRNTFDTSMQSAINSAGDARRNVTSDINAITGATSRAAGQVRILHQSLANLPAHKSVSVTVTTTHVQVGSVQSGATAVYSRGGYVTGGVPGRDSVPALLTPGEYVETVAEARRLRGGGVRTAPNVGGGAAATVINVNVYGVVASDLDNAARQIHQALLKAKRNGLQLNLA